MRPLRHNGIPYAEKNVVMLWSSAVAQGYTAPIWSTFRQAKELDDFVRKSEKGFVMYGRQMIAARFVA